MSIKAHSFYTIVDITDGIQWQEDADKHPADPANPPKEGWAYYNTKDKCSYIYDGSRWVVFAKDGDTGDVGPGISEEIIEYCQSSSNASAPTSGWGDFPSTWNKNAPYVWYRTKQAWNYTDTNGNYVIKYTPARLMSQLDVATNMAKNDEMSLDDWCVANDVTVISGAQIATGSITADHIVTTDLEAEIIHIKDGDDTVFLADAKQLPVIIGGFNVSTDSIYHTKAAYNDATNDGVYLGTDGIGLGKGSFYVTKEGNLFVTSGDVGGWNITADGITKDAAGLLSGATHVGNSLVTDGATSPVRFYAGEKPLTFTGSPVTQSTYTISGGVISITYIYNPSNDMASIVDFSVLSVDFVNSSFGGGCTIRSISISSGRVTVVVDTPSSNYYAFFNADRAISCVIQYGTECATKILNDGSLYTTAAHLSGNVYVDGEVHASSGVIGGCGIVDGKLNVSSANISDKLTADKINVQDLISNGSIAVTGDIPTEDSITQITNKTISTTNVVAENLVVNASKINGQLTADQINADGITAVDVNISGKITSVIGSIGGWNISEDGIIKGSVGLLSGSARTMSSLVSNGTSNIRIYAGRQSSDYNFTVAPDLSPVFSNYGANSVHTAIYRYEANYITSDTEVSVVGLYRAYGGSSVEYDGVKISVFDGYTEIKITSTSTSYDTDKLRVSIRYPVSLNPMVAILEDGSFYAKSASITGGVVKIQSSDGYTTIGSGGMYVKDSDDGETGAGLRMCPNGFIIDDYTISGGSLIKNAYTLLTASSIGGETTGKLHGTWSIDKQGSSTPITSDQNSKHSIRDQSLAYSKVFDALRPVTFCYNDGTSGRTHTGLVAQEVEEAVIDAGLTTMDFAALCYDADELGTKSHYGIRYEELVSLCIYEIQKLKARVKELEVKLKEE